MKKLLIVISFILVFSFSAFAQNKNDEKGEIVKCPTVSITSPPAPVRPGETATFTVTVSGGTQNPKKIKYVWSVNEGKIVSGQGTMAITVSTKGLEDTQVTATINLKGLPESCPNEFSESGVTNCGSPKPVLIDEFGKTGIDDLRQRLDNFLVELENDPNSTGYILSYGAKKDIDERKEFFEVHLTQRKFPLDRIVFLNGGKEKTIRTKLWLIPVGADPSTID